MSNLAAIWLGVLLAALTAVGLAATAPSRPASPQLEPGRVEAAWRRLRRGALLAPALGVALAWSALPTRAALATLLAAALVLPWVAVAVGVRRAPHGFALGAAVAMARLELVVTGLLLVLPLFYLLPGALVGLAFAARAPRQGLPIVAGTVLSAIGWGYVLVAHRAARGSAAWPGALSARGAVAALLWIVGLPTVYALQASMRRQRAFAEAARAEADSARARTARRLPPAPAAAFASVPPARERWTAVVPGVTRAASGPRLAAGGGASVFVAGSLVVFRVGEEGATPIAGFAGGLDSLAVDGRGRLLLAARKDPRFLLAADARRARAIPGLYGRLLALREDGTILARARDGIVALGADGSRRRWSMDEGTVLHVKLDRRDGRLRVGTTDALLVFDPRGGLAWRRTGPAWSVDAAPEGGTYAAGPDGVSRLDAAGRVLWIAPIRWIDPRLTADEHGVVVMGGSTRWAGAVEAVALDTLGRTRWTLPIPGELGERSAPRRLADGGWIVRSDSLLVALTPDGRPRWTLARSPGRRLVPIAIGADGTAYLATHEGEEFRVRAFGGADANRR